MLNSQAVSLGLLLLLKHICKSFIHPKYSDLMAFNYSAGIAWGDMLEELLLWLIQHLWPRSLSQLGRTNIRTVTGQGMPEDL